eukprot:10826938-Heterocapsa_arctica.AAC.1
MLIYRKIKFAGVCGVSRPALLVFPRTRPLAGADYSEAVYCLSQNGDITPSCLLRMPYGKRRLLYVQYTGQPTRTHNNAG